MSSDEPEQVPVPLTRMFGALLRIPFQALVEEIEIGLHAHGFGDLRPTHLTVFQHLPSEGDRLTRVAASAQMTKQSMGELVRYLEQGGYLERAPDPEDGRASIVRRTERGWEVERVARESIGAKVNEWRTRIGGQEFDQMLETLEDLVALVEHDASDDR